MNDETRANIIFEKNGCFLIYSSQVSFVGVDFKDFSVKSENNFLLSAQNLSTLSYIVFFSKKKNIYLLKECHFNNITFEGDEKQTMIKGEMSTILFWFVEFKNISLEQSSLLQTDSTDIEFINCFFYEINQNIDKTTGFLIYLKYTPAFIKLDNCTFSLMILGKINF